MMINTVAALKRNKRVLVEVMAISDEDIATVKMISGGTVFKVDLNELEETGAIQPHREPERERYIS